MRGAEAGLGWKQEPDSEGLHVRWLIDGMNVIGSRPTGWWRDRPGAMRNLAQKLATFARSTGDEVVVVFDGRPLKPPLEAAGIEVAFAPGGRNAADREIVRRAAADQDPESIRVVTSDAALAAQVESLGAEVVGASYLLRCLDQLGSTGRG